MMMFLVGSEVSTLAHSTSVDLGAVFSDQTDVAIYVCQSQPKTCPPVMFFFLFRGKIYLKTLSWMESIFFQYLHSAALWSKWFDPLASSHFEVIC